MPRRWLALAALGIALVGIVLAVLLVPTASITLTVPVTALSAPVRMAVAVPAVSARGVPTTPASVPAASQTQTVAATGKVPAVAATGTVLFSWRSCFQVPFSSPCPTPPPSVAIPQGTAVATCPGTAEDQPCPHRGVEFVTTSPATLTLSGGSNSVTVPIRAADPGAAGDTAAFAIDVIVSPGFPRSEYKVSNPEPTRGGADPTGVAVAQNDIDQTAAGLGAALKARQAASLAGRARAQGLVIVGDPHFTYGVSSDHQAGDPVARVAVTVRVAADAIAVPDSELRGLAVQALQAKAPAGELVVAASVAWEKPVLFPAQDGPRVITVAHGVSSRVDPARVRRLATGSSPGGTALLLRQTYGASAVTVAQWPVALPWLPLLQGRISVSVRY
jgi:hypothetical protein